MYCLLDVITYPSSIIDAGFAIFFLIKRSQESWSSYLINQIIDYSNTIAVDSGITAVTLEKNFWYPGAFVASGLFY